MVAGRDADHRSLEFCGWAIGWYHLENNH
jgi:hypothetical protein